MTILHNLKYAPVAQSDQMTPTEKLDRIHRLALAYNSSAVNIGAHRLAGLVLDITRDRDNGTEKQKP